ncbi:MAG: hypothetical protein GYA55_10395 [SAR324 cluster bacterium]|uniref:Uncharacterized protein n=1 Tax=SAR324 cluster bacterium TaxID=2024889 RepID=A0A7X9FSM0_9DELT|nr:hypothetical protein [SAR324 cluster bacterium]
MPTKTNKRITQVLISSAIVLLTLGAGNLFFGLQKHEKYQDLYSKANIEIQNRESSEASSKRQSMAALEQANRFLPGPNLDKQAQYLNRVRTQVRFYEFVISGGKLFICLSAVCFLSGLLVKRYTLH